MNKQELTQLVAEILTQAGIPHAYYRVDTFSQYLTMLEQFCTMTGRQDLYEENGLAVQAQIDSVLESVTGEVSPEVLLLRCYSTGVKAKGADNLTGWYVPFDDVCKRIPEWQSGCSFGCCLCHLEHCP